MAVITMVVVVFGFYLPFVNYLLEIPNQLFG
jgi:hypothetical protein